MKYGVGIALAVLLALTIYIGIHRKGNTAVPTPAPTPLAQEPERDPAIPESQSKGTLASIISAILHPKGGSLTASVTSLDSTTSLQETGALFESNSSMWWVNSGGYMLTTNGVNETIQGDLPTTDKWYIAYSKANPVDTDGGSHPQNIFRLVNKRKWQNYTEQAYFRITKQNLSASDQRDAWSGLLLFNRYADENNLYYAGIRVDGTAVIKSKKKGIYTTLTQVPVFPGTYDRVTNPTLLPQNTWIGLRTEVKTLLDGSVSIKLYMDNGMTGTWKLLTSYVDSDNPVRGFQYNGIRTDFMDVQFQGYQVKGI